MADWIPQDIPAGYAVKAKWPRALLGGVAGLEQLQPGVEDVAAQGVPGLPTLRPGVVQGVGDFVPGPGLPGGPAAGSQRFLDAGGGQSDLPISAVSQASLAPLQALLQPGVGAQQTGLPGVSAGPPVLQDDPIARPFLSKYPELAGMRGAPPPLPSHVGMMGSNYVDPQTGAPRPDWDNAEKGRQQNILLQQDIAKQYPSLDELTRRLSPQVPSGYYAGNPDFAQYELMRQRGTEQAGTQYSALQEAMQRVRSDDSNRVLAQAKLGQEAKLHGETLGFEREKLAAETDPAKLFAKLVADRGRQDLPTSGFALEEAKRALEDAGIKAPGTGTVSGGGPGVPPSPSTKDPGVESAGTNEPWKPHEKEFERRLYDVRKQANLKPNEVMDSEYAIAEFLANTDDKALETPEGFNAVTGFLRHKYGSAFDEDFWKKKTSGSQAVGLSEKSRSLKQNDRIKRYFRQHGGSDEPAGGGFLGPAVRGLGRLLF